MHDEPNYIDDTNEQAPLELIADLEEKIRKQVMHIARLQRENTDLKAENKKLAELPYLLRQLNIAKNSLARIVRMGSMGAQGNVLKDAIDIAKQAERNISAENKEWLKYHPSDHSTLPETETY